MQQIPWFDRKFQFPKEQNVFPATLERLADTPLRLQHKLSAYPADILITRIDEAWSIQEQLGHLIDLEPLWQGRLQDILEGKDYLREADLSNTQTHEAGHNDKKLADLLEEFSALRRQTVQALRAVTEEQVFLSGLHPRLHQPMRLMDLFIFVAEHDDHHLVQMTALAARFGHGSHT